MRTLHQASKLLELLLHEMEGCVLTGEQVNVEEDAIASDVSDDLPQLASIVEGGVLVELEVVLLVDLSILEERNC